MSVNEPAGAQELKTSLMAAANIIWGGGDRHDCIQLTDCMRIQEMAMVDEPMIAASAGENMTEDAQDADQDAPSSPPLAEDDEPVPAPARKPLSASITNTFLSRYCYHHSLLKTCP